MRRRRFLESIPAAVAAIKAGFVAGAPLEIMVTGRLYDEATTLRVALAHERSTKWHTMNPPGF